MTTPDHTDKALAKLREPFPPEQIFALPRVTCRACTNSHDRVCGRHRLAKCQRCGSYITTAHIDLDYVGHAELTNRLLDADPYWTWEPLGVDDRGLPAFDADGGLWIRLTIAGHTRLGYGDSQGKKGPNAVKEAIGDALRNAAMRFGAALDLWAKSDLRAAQAEHPATEEEHQQQTNGNAQEQRDKIEAQRAWEQARDQLIATGARKGLDPDGIAAWCIQQSGIHPKDATTQNLIDAHTELTKMPDKNTNTPPQRPHGSDNHPAGRKQPQRPSIPPQRPNGDYDS